VTFHVEQTPGVAAIICGGRKRGCRGVIGCVWGAWRTLSDELGIDAPDYEWCEAEWRRVRRSMPPPGPALPEALTEHLRATWRDRPGQQTLW